MGIDQSLTDANGFFSFSGGSNLRVGTNPPYGIDDFLSFYPQFNSNSQGQSGVPSAVLQTFIDMANGCIQQVRWRTAWPVAMASFVAHFCHLYLQATQATPDSGAQAVLEAGRAQGVLTGESVGDISYSADTNVSSVDGWAQWNTTEYGRTLATLGKLYGKGGMLVY